MVIPGCVRLLGGSTPTPWYALCDRRALQGTVDSFETDHESAGSIRWVDDRQILLS